MRFRLISCAESVFGSKGKCTFLFMRRIYPKAEWAHVRVAHACPRSPLFARGGAGSHYSPQLCHLGMVIISLRGGGNLGSERWIPLSSLARLWEELEILKPGTPASDTSRETILQRSLRSLQCSLQLPKAYGAPRIWTRWGLSPLVHRENLLPPLVHQPQGHAALHLGRCPGFPRPS